MQPRLAEARAIAVNVVADNGPALGRGMHAQLVSAAGHRFHREPGQAVGPAQHLPSGDGRLTVRIRFLPPAALFIQPAERQIDNALVLGGSAFNDSPIGFGNPAMFEQKPKRRRCLAMPAQDEAARGVLVEPMGEHRRPRQSEAQRVERRFQIRAALGSAMDRQASRLVDDQHQPVAMEYARLDFFGRQFGNIHEKHKTFVCDRERLTHPP